MEWSRIVLQLALHSIQSCERDGIRGKAVWYLLVQKPVSTRGFGQTAWDDMEYQVMSSAMHGSEAVASIHVMNEERVELSFIIFIMCYVGCFRRRCCCCCCWCYCCVCWRPQHATALTWSGKLVGTDALVDETPPLA